jgi:porphobilinogen deaminase
MAILRIGSRGSQLALWQANHISVLLRARARVRTCARVDTNAFARIGTELFTLQTNPKDMLP